MEAPDHIISYLLRHSNAGLLKTQVVKLLYLMDVTAAESGHAPVTGVRWIRFHHGPWSVEVEGSLTKLRRDGTVRREDGARRADGASYELYRHVAGSQACNLEPVARRLADFVLERYGDLRLEALLEAAYGTGPMRANPSHGDELDLGLAHVDDCSDEEDLAWLHSGPPWAGESA